MPADAAVPAPAPAPPKLATDPRFDRIPMVRHAMILLVPKAGGGSPSKVSITEIKTGGRLEITEGGSAFEKSVDLNVIELRQLADFCNRIARRVAMRPEGRP